VNERNEARAFSELIDGALSYEDLEQEGVDVLMVSVVRRLARLPDLLDQPDQAFVRELMARAPQDLRRAPRFGLRWKLALPAVAVLLVLLGVGLFSPRGLSALAGFAARFGLGRFAVQVTPQPGGEGDSFVLARRERLVSVEEAQARVDYNVLTPVALPPGYSLREITAVTYEDMPVWIPQPFYLELEYRRDGRPELHHLTLREFGLALREGAYMRRIRQVDFASQDVSNARDVLVHEFPAALLTMPTEPGIPPLKRLIWQQGEVVVEMLSQTLGDDELLWAAEQMTDGH
jgi:hypothetical protein